METFCHSQVSLVRVLWEGTSHLGVFWWSLAAYMNLVARALTINVILNLFDKQLSMLYACIFKRDEVSSYTNSLDVEQHSMENRPDTSENKVVSQSSLLSPPKGRLPKVNLIREGT